MVDCHPHTCTSNGTPPPPLAPSPFLSPPPTGYYTPNTLLQELVVRSKLVTRLDLSNCIQLQHLVIPALHVPPAQGSPDQVG